VPKAKKAKPDPPPPRPPPARRNTRARAPLGERRDAVNAPVVRNRGAAAAGKRPVAAVAGKAAKRTYGGRRGAATEGKENEGEDTSHLADSSDSIKVPPVVSRGKGKAPAAAAAVPKKQSEEMERLKRKFAEVDAWEMDYESVDMGGTSGSWR
jgi:hypothetical protein